MNKREQSEFLVAKLVAKLADSGVAPTETRASDYFDEVDSEKVKLFIRMIEWLKAEGVIRLFGKPLLGDQNGPIFDLVLTSQGFQYLAQKQANGLTLVENAKRIATAPKAATALGEFIGTFLGSFTKSMSS